MNKIMKTNFKKGDIADLLLIPIGLMILLLIGSLALSFDRFNKVENATTEEELIVACEEYKMANIKDVPVRCFNLLTK